MSIDRATRNGKQIPSCRHVETFANAQPLYAEHGIATFPVTAEKKPAVGGYLHTGLKGSQALAAKFGNAPALGFVTDDRNGITVLDVDTPDERVLVRALDQHGHTPLIARTGSGKYHAYYRYNGERRRIRPWPGREIDLLGTGRDGDRAAIEGCQRQLCLHRGLARRRSSTASSAQSRFADRSRAGHAQQSTVAPLHEGRASRRHLRRSARRGPHVQRGLPATNGGYRGDISRTFSMGLHGAWGKPFWTARRMVPKDEVNRLIDNPDAFVCWHSFAPIRGRMRRSFAPMDGGAVWLAPAASGRCPTATDRAWLPDGHPTGRTTDARPVSMEALTPTTGKNEWRNGTRNAKHDWPRRRRHEQETQRNPYGQYRTPILY